MNEKTKKGIALFLFVVAVLGFIGSLVGLIAPSEPLVVLLLSWAALGYEASNSLFITHQGDSGE